MKLTRTTLETKGETILEITESEFKEVSAKVVAEACDKNSELMKDSPMLNVMSVMMYTEIIARLAQKLFEEED